jgi:hypothetical protein
MHEVISIICGDTLFAFIRFLFHNGLTNEDISYPTRVNDEVDEPVRGLSAVPPQSVPRDASEFPPSE